VDLDPLAVRHLALQQMQFARQYTLSLLADIDEADWFTQPSGCPSHLAWQVAHLAMAQYGLMLLRARGKQPEDQQLLSNDFFRRYKKGSTPDASLENNMSIAEIRDVFGRVHEQALAELPTFSAEVLLESVPEPYAVYPNKLGSLLFCAAHEMMHAGQIGLIRRLLGKPPVR
jgi:hypothetical protein